MRSHSGRSHNGLVTVISTIATIAVAGSPAAAGLSKTADAFDVAVPAVVASVPEQPHLLHGGLGDVVVRLQGHVCSGTPITGTVYVVTAAHCVLTEDGEVTQRTVVRDHIRYPAVAVLVDTEYHDHPSEALDAAVLVMAQVIPGPSVGVASALPDSGSVTLAGFQPLDSDGSLLRGPRRHEVAGEDSVLPYQPGGCSQPVEALDVSTARVLVPCGLVPGASGGGLFAEQGGQLVLVGIISTVTAGERGNGIVPLSSLQKLLQHPDRYAHGFHAAGAHDRDGSRSADVIEAWSSSRTDQHLATPIRSTYLRGAAGARSAASTGGDPAGGETDASYFARTGGHLP